VDDVEIPFHQMTFMYGSAPKRRRSSSTFGATPILPVLKRLCTAWSCMTRSICGVATCRPRHTIGPLGPWAPEDVAGTRIDVGASALFGLASWCCVRRVPGTGCKCSKHGNYNRHRKGWDWSYAGRIRFVARAVDSSPRRNGQSRPSPRTVRRADGRGPLPARNLQNCINQEYRDQPSP
jgi:hypothetical protein